MQKIFISYKRQDKEKVFKIVDDIKSKTGVDCWIDLEGIESGDQFQNVIIKAINNADIVIFMLSKNFIAPYRDEKTGEVDETKQTYPEKEVMYALRHNKRLIPVSIDGTKIDACDWLEFNCSNLDCIDYSNKDQKAKLIKNLKTWTNKDDECGLDKGKDKYEVATQSVAPTGKSRTPETTGKSTEHVRKSSPLPYTVKYVNWGIGVQTVIFTIIVGLSISYMTFGNIAYVHHPDLFFKDFFLALDLLIIIWCTLNIKKYSWCKWSFLILDIIAIILLFIITIRVYKLGLQGGYRSDWYQYIASFGKNCKYHLGLMSFIFVLLYIFHNAIIHIFMNCRILWYKLPYKLRKMLKL